MYLEYMSSRKIKTTTYNNGAGNIRKCQAINYDFYCARANNKFDCTIVWMWKEYGTANASESEPSGGNWGAKNSAFGKMTSL